MSHVFLPADKLSAIRTKNTMDNIADVGFLCPDLKLFLVDGVRLTADISLTGADKLMCSCSCCPKLRVHCEQFVEKSF